MWPSSPVPAGCRATARTSMAPLPGRSAVRPYWSHRRRLDSEPGPIRRPWGPRTRAACCAGHPAAPPRRLPCRFWLELGLVGAVTPRLSGPDAGPASPARNAARRRGRRRPLSLPPGPTVLFGGVQLRFWPGKWLARPRLAWSRRAGPRCTWAGVPAPPFRGPEPSAAELSHLGHP